MLSGTLLFLDISGGEFLIIVVAIFLIFGPKKMPEMARKVGRVMNELKKASGDITREFREETGSITREIAAARESVRREADNLRKDLPGLATIATEDTSIYPEPSKPQPEKEEVTELTENISQEQTENPKTNN